MVNFGPGAVKKRVLETSFGKLLMEPFDRKTPESSSDRALRATGPLGFVTTAALASSQEV